MSKLASNLVPNRRARHWPSNALLSIAVLLAGQSVQARSADRQLPADISAGYFSENPEERTVTYSRDVVLEQGTLKVYAENATVHMDENNNFTRVVLVGEPVRWQEVLEDGQPLDARARRIDYQLAAEQVTLTGAVLIDRGSDQIAGERVNYDMKNSRLNAGEESGDGRIRMRITPKAKNDADDDDS